MSDKIKFKSIVLIVFLFLSGSMLAQSTDINLLRDINLNRNKSLDTYFRVITNSVYPVSIATPIVIFSIGLIKDDATLIKQGIFIGETILASAFITTALKYSIRRERPFVTYPDIEKETWCGSLSFPSGHTSNAFSTATSLSVAFPKWYVIAPTFVWAFAVGYSRMDLGVHYPSDVIAGALIGSGSAFLTYKLNKLINRKAKKELLFDGIF